jgi:6-pyruvoyltetrahydropterin/6-carboxytetrahydropterin synthase
VEKAGSVIVGGMKVALTRMFQIEAAHRLPRLPKGHKCERMHGHSFKIEVRVEGECDPKLGWLMDYADIKKAFEPLFEQLDHRCLNEVSDLDNPTSENLAKWVWDRLKPSLPMLTAVIVAETCTASAEYRG